MATEIRILIDSNTLKRLIIDALSSKLNTILDIDDIKIEVKASMNYRSEWEKGEFHASIVKYT